MISIWLSRQASTLSLAWIIILSILSISYILTNKEEVLIPKEAIRFRIIANSNNIKDQAIKQEIKNELKEAIIPEIEQANNIEQTRRNIINSIPLIEDKLNNYNIDYNISFGNNYFPLKEYKGITYKEGNYESLVITIGNGLGDNYWCVLYPPLCLIEDNNTSNIEYKSLVKEIITKYKP